MSSTSIAVSSPGKVLFTGGFLVLDRKHSGLVLGLDARIHVHIEDYSSADAQNDGKTTHILVQSPQFRDASWLYKLKADAVDTSNFLTQVTIVEGHTQSANKFVETTLRYVYSYFAAKGTKNFPSARLTILADRSYYSDSGTTTQGKAGFNDFGCKISEAHKTGLGSSAALVTSLTGALVAWNTRSAEADLPRKTIHNLAQAAHCAAQGKVGSGFDVAAATFGACLYRRFSPEILEQVGDSSVTGFGERLKLCVDDLNIDKKWDVEIASDAVQIPRSLLLLMCDVDCGSETPGMVRQVLAWRKEKPSEADLLWNAIQQGSNELCARLTRISALQGIDQRGASEIQDILNTIRSLVREMSDKSGVPIEPKIITELLDYCGRIPGVIGGVAPGAGGYDAVALLVENKPEVVAQLEAKLGSWKAREEGSGVQIGKVRLLTARQAYEGVRYEEIARYADWTNS